MDLGIKGKVALVTASSGGLGAAIADVLIEEGVAVAITGTNAEKLEKTAAALRAKGGKVVSLVWDLGDLSLIEPSIARVEAELGPIDILVNNTGGPPALARIGAGAGALDEAFPVDGALGDRDHGSRAAGHEGAKMGPCNHLDLDGRDRADPEPRRLQYAARQPRRLVEDREP